MYLVKFENLYYKKVWGGRDFEAFRDNLPEGDIGESWDIACHKNGMSIVQNGIFKGKKFEELIKEYKKEILGKNFKDKDFPLLIKLINSKERLSVQVHPNDEYAKRYENSLGKTEAWYVVDAKKGAKLIIGTKNCDKKIFEKAIFEGKTKEYLNEIEVKKGDFFLINSGMVHAICEGVIIAEIQQNSDITYRIYDYERERDLHIEKSLDVINFELKSLTSGDKELEKKEGCSKTVLCKSNYFTIEKYIINGKIKEKSDINKFYLLTCVDGNGIIESKGENVSMNKGDSILVPASLGEYVIQGDLTILKSYI